MRNPKNIGDLIVSKIKKEWKIAFLAAILLGFAVHMPALISDVPNHDGLDSLYFDQNMITSGRWFLTVACGMSSYYSLPWLIGVLGMIYLALTAVVLVDLLEVKNNISIISISAILVLFPSVASNFAYVFTMDGYFLGLLLAVLSVWMVSKHRLGFLFGGLCLMFSMGTYQAYLAFAVLLCIYCVVIGFIEKADKKEKMLVVAKYLGMGAIGVSLYYLVLQVLLFIQGKELASYQGIDGMVNTEGMSIIGTLKQMYLDFLSFTIKGKILCNNVFSYGAILLLVVVFLAAVIRMWLKKYRSKIGFYALVVALILGVPVATNLILFISPNVTYHLLMRYQWCLFPIIMIAFAERFGEKKSLAEWCVLLGTVLLIFNYAVTNNIAYSNLQKRYEKTYAYCVRLLDRIEQTPGYYQGIPIAMIGVVGDESYPQTDITGEVTGSMIGIYGDSLLYTGQNYELFIKHYLGASLNILEPEAMEEMYYDALYVEMGSFPAEDSIKIVDGIMYIKTENTNRGE